MPNCPRPCPLGGAGSQITAAIAPAVDTASHGASTTNPHCEIARPDRKFVAANTDEFHSRTRP